MADTVAVCVRDGLVSSGDEDGGGRCRDDDFSSKVSEWVGLAIDFRVSDSMDGSDGSAAPHRDVEVFQAPSRNFHMDCRVSHSIDSSDGGAALRSDVDGQGDCFAEVSG